MIYVRLKPNWNGVFKRTIKDRDGKQLKVRTFTPGEVVGVEPIELPSLKRDIGNAIQPVEWSEEHGKFRPIDVADVDLDAMVKSVLNGTFVDSQAPPVPENVDRLPERRRHPEWTGQQSPAGQQAETGQQATTGQEGIPVADNSGATVRTNPPQETKNAPRGRAKPQSQKPAKPTSTPTPTGEQPEPPAPENAAGDASTEAKADVTADATGTTEVTDGANAG